MDKFINKIIQGDCLEVMKQMPDSCIDLTVTSPPYDNLRAYENNIDTTWCQDVWGSIIKELFRITKPGGIVVWVVGDATIKGSETGTSFRQALYAMECGFNLHDTMIWNKGKFSAVGALRTRYAPVFEYMFIFSKGKTKTFNPIKDRKNKTAGQIVNGNIRQKDGTMKPKSSIGKITAEYGQRFNIWVNAPQQGRNDHPAPFPEQLASDHIISWSNEGDIVLDPFTGSGTTAKMAIANKRKFVGIEISEEYCQIARERVAKADKTGTLFAM